MIQYYITKEIDVVPGWNMDLSTAQTNSTGQVALCYFQTTNPIIHYNAEIGYAFRTHANICLAWVNLEHAQRLLDMRGGCCGGRKPIIRVASALDVERWSQL
jgi:hypothetical protein